MEHLPGIDPVDVTSDDPEAVFTALDLVRSGGRVILASTKGNRAFHFLSDVIVAKLEALAAAHGPRFAPAQVLADHAASGELFRG